jgi:hypothetical protein
MYIYALDCKKRAALVHPVTSMKRRMRHGLSWHAHLRLNQTKLSTATEQTVLTWHLQNVSLFIRKSSRWLLDVILQRPTESTGKYTAGLYTHTSRKLGAFAFTRILNTVSPLILLKFLTVFSLSDYIHSFIVNNYLLAKIYGTFFFSCRHFCLCPLL